MASDKILQLGVCDYPEQVSVGHWRTQPARMKELGISYIRLAEFAWAKLEPARDQFDFAWLDDAIATAQAAGLKVVLCTPTATPPAWLLLQHPDILALDANGQVRGFGSRRHYCFSSQRYWQESQRIVEIVAQRYGTHEAVVGWQTDNEYGCHDTARSYSMAAQQGFREWLEKKYLDINHLNQAWGNVFWSQTYSAWNQINLPNQTVTEPNPSHVLDFYRYSSDQLIAYDQMQCEIIRAKSPGRFITHNFMIFESGFDHYKAAQHLDFVSWDNYPLGTLENFANMMDEQTKQDFARTGHPDLTACIHDIYRGLKQKSFWVMEQQCGQTNWAKYNPLPAAGAVKLWTLQAFAHGADCVSYFRWQAASAAQEVLHSGLQKYDGSPDRGYAEVAELAPQLKKIPSGKVTTKIALLHDYESLWITDQQPHGQNATYWAQLLMFYGVLREQGLDVDVLHPDTDLSAHSLVVAPAITIMSEARAKHFENTARAGTHFVFGPRTGFRNPSGKTWDTLAPGPLASAAGVRLKNFDSLRPGLSSRINFLDQNFSSHTWNESYEVMADDVIVLGHYQDDPMYNQAAITNRKLGAGSISMMGAWGEKMFATFLEFIAPQANLRLENLPKGMRISRRDGAVFVQNWSRGGLIAPASEQAKFLYGSPLLAAGGVAVYKEP